MKEINFEFPCVLYVFNTSSSFESRKKNYDLTETLFSTYNHNVNNSYTSHLQNMHNFTKLFTFHQNDSLILSTLVLWIYKTDPTKSLKEKRLG